jgi:hypothetical protein
MKPTFFTFNFFDEINETETDFQFEFINPDDKLIAMGYGQDDDLNKFKSEMEIKYGIHDISAAEEDIFGFTTYEIDIDDYLLVMNTWRNHFISLGYECTEIHQILEKS